MSEQVRIAVVGVGAFGKNHARVLSALDEAALVAVVDADRERAEAVAAEYGCLSLADPAELAGRVEAAVVAVPTVHHEAVAAPLLEAGIDLLVEKPAAPDLESLDRMAAAADANGRIVQVGHLERFNPAVQAAFETATLPLFFEVHRLGMFSPRSLDVDVVMDLMIHDLDILLAMIESPIERIEASGIPILSQQADIASVRIVFANGAVANLTASRISTEKVRKLRFFQPRQYVSVDYTRQDGVLIGLGDDNQMQFRALGTEKGEPLERQARAFLDCVRTRREPLVSAARARGPLEAALRIRAEMDRHAEIVRATVAAAQQQ